MGKDIFLVRLIRVKARIVAVKRLPGTRVLPGGGSVPDGALANQALAAMAVTSTRMPGTASAATPTAARTGQGLAKKRW